MPLLKEDLYTIDDIYALPDGERAELIDGHIYYMLHQAENIRIFQWNYLVQSKITFVHIVGNAKSMQLHLQFT